MYYKYHAGRSGSRKYLEGKGCVAEWGIYSYNIYDENGGV
jgi:hypothetical protein